MSPSTATVSAQRSAPVAITPAAASAAVPVAASPRMLFGQVGYVLTRPGADGRVHYAALPGRWDTDLGTAEVRNCPTQVAYSLPKDMDLSDARVSRITTHVFELARDGLGRPQALRPDQQLVIVAMAGDGDKVDHVVTANRAPGFAYRVGTAAHRAVTVAPPALDDTAMLDRVQGQIAPVKPDRRHPAIRHRLALAVREMKIQAIG